MKKRIWIKAIFAIMLGVLAVVASSLFIGAKVAAQSSHGDAFDYSNSPSVVRYKAMQSDQEQPTRKGLKLFSYDSGASAVFKAQLNGSFIADMKAIKNSSGIDLTKYSLEFTDKATNKNFSVSVANRGSYNDIYINYNGERAGIYYYTSQVEVKGKANGFTALYNRAGSYTSVSSNDICLKFDPDKMQVSVLGDAGSYNLVWDFKQEYNDGKRLINDLPIFEEYSVKIIFDEIKTNGKGELLIYSLGGYYFGDEGTVKPRVSANIIANAIVGKEYDIPEAKIFDLFKGNLPSDNLSVRVFDNTGKEITDCAKSFTPEKEGEYYIHYSYTMPENGELTSTAMYRIVALNQESITGTFIYDEEIDNLTVGARQTLRIPEGRVESNLIVGGSAVLPVTIKKDGKEVENHQTITGGCEYEFIEAGEYKIVYSTDRFGMLLADEKTITASNDIPVFMIDEFTDVVPYMTEVALEKGKVYYNGQYSDTTTSIIYPSGKVVEGERFTADEIGIYTVKYRFEEVECEKHFESNKRNSDLFSVESGSCAYATLESNNTINGQLITLTNNNAAVFNEIIDLSDNRFDSSLSDKSTNTPLLELYAQPHSVGISDVQALYIKLTDAHDSNNYINIRVRYLSYLPHNMRIRAMASGQAWVGYDYHFYTGAISVDSAQSHEDGGTIVAFDCTQSATSGKLLDKKLRLYFDNETGCLYTRTWQDKAANSTADNLIPIPWLIRDFKTADAKHSAGDPPWRGFSTGEVYLSIYATGISDTANFIVTNIDGKDMSGEYFNDAQPPIIEIDGDSEVQAQVNKSFKVFDFTAIDAYSSVVEKTYKVWHNGKEVDVIDGRFTPKAIGEYTIEYTATDAFGNQSQKSVTVQAKNKLDALKINVDGSIPSSLSFGQIVRLPSATASGGSGKYNITVKAEVIGDDGNRTEVEIKNGMFSCTANGTYLITYKAKDHLENEAGKTLRFSVKFSEVPVFDEMSIVLPSAFMSGELYNFKQYTAKYYNGSDAMLSVNAKIIVSDAEGEREITDGSYTPIASDDVKNATIKFVFATDKQTKIIEKVIPILVAKRGLNYLTGFFTSSYADVIGENDAIMFTPNASEDIEFAFARAISQRFLNIGFIKSAKNSFKRMTIYFRDIYDSDAVVKLNYRYSGGKLTFSVNDGTWRNANFNEKGSFAVKYDISTNRILDVLGTEIGAINNYVNGAEFAGFPSGLVYMSVQADGAVGITEIANQNFNNYPGDTIKPIVVVSESFSGVYFPGQKIILPAAQAYDVISTVTAIKIIVKSPSGKQVLSKDATKPVEFIPEEYGVYSVTYQATDSAGNKIPVISSLVVVDDVLPTLKFDGDIPTTGKAGKTITLPEYTISDNGDLVKVVVKKYVCGPDGIILPIGADNKIAFNRRGEYIVYYFVVDENNNTNNYSFTIKVN